MEMPRWQPDTAPGGVLAISSMSMAFEAIHAKEASVHKAGIPELAATLHLVMQRGEEGATKGLELWVTHEGQSGASWVPSENLPQGGGNGQGCPTAPRGELETPRWLLSRNSLRGSVPQAQTPSGLSQTHAHPPKPRRGGFRAEAALLPCSLGLPQQMPLPHLSFDRANLSYYHNMLFIRQVPLSLPRQAPHLVPEGGLS